MTKQTILHDKHVELGAKMVDFAGWHMPVQYTSIIDEHNNVRENVGLFDVSHMGEVFIKGPDALKLLNKLVPQDISKLTDTKAVYCQLTNKLGGIKDDWIVYKLEDNYYMVIANASMVESDVNWIAMNKGDLDVEIINDSHNYSMIAVQGPKACDLIKDFGVDDLPTFFSITKKTLLGHAVFVSRTGYTGEDGVEVIIENKYAEELWDKLLEVGKKYGVKPIGLGARDTLRLESAMPLYGNDLDENTSPIEAGLKWSIPTDKVDNYNGKEVIDNQIKNGIDKKLVGFKMLDRGIARHEYEVYFNNEKVGVVTSGGVSPTRGDNIGLAYVKNLDNLTVGSTIQIMIRDKMYNAEVIKKPFVNKRNKI